MKTYLDFGELTLLERAAANLRDRLLIRLLYRLGCRISEILGIEVGHIDFAGGIITIQHLKARIRLNCPFCQSKLSQTSVYCPKCGSEFIVTRGGEGTVTCCGQPMEQKK